MPADDPPRPRREELAIASRPSESAYAEDAYGKSGYFVVFLLCFFSLAIGNVAIAISAVSHLATFFPWLASTSIATCIGVIGPIWLTTVANFGGRDAQSPRRECDFEPALRVQRVPRPLYQYTK